MLVKVLVLELVRVIAIPLVELDVEDVLDIAGVLVEVVVEDAQVLAKDAIIFVLADA